MICPTYSMSILATKQNCSTCVGLRFKPASWLMTHKLNTQRIGTAYHVKGTLDGLLEMTRSSNVNTPAASATCLMCWIDIWDRYSFTCGWQIVPLSICLSSLATNGRHATVSRNAALMDQYLEMMHGFWDYVRADSVPPTKRCPRLIGHRSRSMGSKFEMPTTTIILSAAHDYVSTLFSHKQHESIKKELRSMINDDEREVTSNLVSITTEQERFLQNCCKQGGCKWLRKNNRRTLTRQCWRSRN